MDYISGFSGNLVKQSNPRKPNTSTFHLRLQANKLELPPDGKIKQAEVVKVADKGVGGEDEEASVAAQTLVEQSEDRLREKSKDITTSSNDPNSFASSKNDLLIQDMT